MSLIKDLQIKNVNKDHDLSLVRTDDKRQAILNILHSEHPDHYSRLWLVGFLRYVGYKEPDVLKIIDESNNWEDYDPKVTYCQVHSVFKRFETGKRCTNASADRNNHIISSQFFAEPFYKKAASGALEQNNNRTLNSNSAAIFDPVVCLKKNGDLRIKCYRVSCDGCQFREMD